MSELVHSRSTTGPSCSIHVIYTLYGSCYTSYPADTHLRFPSTRPFMILDNLLRQPRERRRLLLSICIVLAVISLLSLLSSAVWTSQPTASLFPDDPSPTPTQSALSEANFDSSLLSSNFINGSPTPHFRGNRLPSPCDHLQTPLDR